MESAEKEPQNPTEYLVAAILATATAILSLATSFIAVAMAHKPNIFIWVTILSMTILLTCAVAAWVRYFWAYIDFRVASTAIPLQQSQETVTEGACQT
jgi:protein-S-isoprenylcysteine O-methyltransferase Ste14